MNALLFHSLARNSALAYKREGGASLVMMVYSMAYLTARGLLGLFFFYRYFVPPGRCSYKLLFNTLSLQNYNARRQLRYIGRTMAYLTARGLLGLFFSTDISSLTGRCSYKLLFKTLSLRNYNACRQVRNSGRTN